MSTYQYIHQAITSPLQCFSLLLGRTEAIYDINIYASSLKSFLKSLIMLLSQHGSRHQHCYLLGYQPAVFPAA